VEVVWDEAKNLANRGSHGLFFEEAAELFTSGIDYLEDTIRILSARWATRRERALYVSYLEPKP
jgi:uncharacterized DUF497 family protein